MLSHDGNRAHSEPGNLQFWRPDWRSHHLTHQPEMMTRKLCDVQIACGGPNLLCGSPFHLHLVRGSTRKKVFVADPNGGSDKTKNKKVPSPQKKETTVLLQRPFSPRPPLDLPSPVDVACPAGAFGPGAPAPSLRRREEKLFTEDRVSQKSHINIYIYMCVYIYILIYIYTYRKIKTNKRSVLMYRPNFARCS